MKISAQLKAIETALKPWQQSNAGTVEIARDIIHAFGMLTQKPGTARAAIVYREETKRGELEETSMVDRKFWVVISQGRSLQLRPADQLTEGTAGGKPLFDLIEESRQIIRGMSFDADTTEVTPNYLGLHPFEAEGWLIAAYYIEFTIGTVLDAP